MNEHQQQRDRAGTVYYDAQPNFGTPPNRVESSGDNYKITMRKESVGSHRDPDEVLYESVHTERRHHHSGYTPSRDRRSPLNSTPVRMAPMTSSYDSSAPPSAFRVHAGADSQIHNQMAGSRWAPQQHEEFKPGPRTSSAANIDARFGRSSRIGVQQYPETGTNMVFSRRNAEPIHQQQKDFSVVGAYASEQHLYGGPNSRHGSVRQHSNEYELDPRLNVTYPQFYVDDWKERHRPRDASAAAAGYTPRAPRPSPSFNSSSPAHPPPRPRFASDANSRHLYEEVPMAATAAASPPHNGYRSPAYGRSNLTATASKETAILDDYDNVPNEFIEGLAQKKTKDDRESNMDGESAIYQPGRYQPSEDAGSSSDEDDPEYLDLMERDSIINRYEKGPDAADVDPWENPDFELYTNMDRFGFVHKKGDKRDEPTDQHKRRILKELGREKKWLKMIEVLNSKGLSKKMEDRIWKGIPEKMRMVIWPRLLGAEMLKVDKSNVYTDLLLRARLVSKDIKQIDLDINRTYRDHLAFRKRYDVKQKSLLNVLAAYSMYNTEVGYCQGMSQIVALFLMYLDEEDAFWSLHQLMVSEKHTMHGFFVPGFPKLQRFEEHFKRVLKKYKPRVYKYLEKQDIPYIYLTKWWFGCFLDRVPFSLALRLWDVFLVEGDPILIAMAFNIMKMHEKTIRKTSMETFMEFIQTDIAENFGYSDDEVMHSLRETLTKLKSDRQHVPPPPRPEDLSEVPTKALGPILQKPMASIREEIHEIQSRRSRANSTGRSPYPKRKESAAGASKGGPPPVTHKWNGNNSQDSILGNGREVPFQIPTRRIAGSPASDASFATPPHNGHQSSSSKREFVQSNASVTPTASSRYHHNPHPSRAGSSTPSTQRLRDDRNGQMVLLSRASDSDGDVTSPINQRDENWSSQQISTSVSSRITHSGNNITRIELDGDVSVI